MDSFNYFNELSAYNQARQLYETYQEDKDQIKQEESEFGGTIGLASASDLVSKSLASDSVKSVLTKLLKTGNADVDSAVEKTIAGVTSDSNPFDVISTLTDQIKPVLKQKATDFVKNAISKITGKNKPQSDLFGSDQPRAFSSADVLKQNPNVDQTFKNPAFNDEGLLDDVADTAEQATSGAGRFLDLGRTAIGNMLERAGVDGDTVNSTLQNLSGRVTSLASDIGQRATGVAEDALSRGRQLLSDAQERGNGILEDARAQIENPLTDEATDAIYRDVMSRAQQSIPDSLLPEGAGNNVTLGDAPIARPPLRREDLPFPEAEPEEEMEIQRDPIDVAMARANPSNSTSNQLGDLLRQGNAEIGSTADAESSQIGESLENLASTGRSLIEPAIADAVPDSLQAVVAPVASAATDALSGLTGGASDAILGATSVEEGIGAALDSTGVLAPIGALLGLLGVGGSLTGILDHHASKPSFNGAMPVFEPGV